MFKLSRVPLLIITHLLKCLAGLGLQVDKTHFDKWFTSEHTPLQHCIDTVAVLDSGTLIPACLRVPGHMYTYTHVACIRESPGTHRAGIGSS